MRLRYSRAVAAITAIAAGLLAAFALRPSSSPSTATLAARNPAVEVRTQVIRRTVHVIRHEPGAGLKGAHGANGMVVGGRRSAGSAGYGGTAASAAGVATRTSGSHAAGVSGAAVPAGSGAPVTTRTSGSHAAAPTSSGAGAPVSTRTSGSHGGSAGGSSAARPVTRSSGAHGGGEDGGHDN
jgi:hypothetical protein